MMHKKKFIYFYAFYIKTRNYISKNNICLK